MKQSQNRLPEVESAMQELAECTRSPTGWNPSSWEPPFTEFTPLATCHWQGIANILETRGVVDPHRKLGLSWGFDLSGATSGRLAGGGRWAHVLPDVYGISVIQFSGGYEYAESLETRIAALDLPYVAEVDASYLESASGQLEHVLRNVIVTQRDNSTAVLVDWTKSSRSVEIPIELYRVMRSAEVAARTEPRKLYAPYVRPRQQQSSENIFKAIRADVLDNREHDIGNLISYVDAYHVSDWSADVCRAAGERYQASLAFRMLADAGLSGAKDFAERLIALSDRWYLIHVISTHQRREEKEHRRRVGRMLRSIIDAEKAAHAQLEHL